MSARQVVLEEALALEEEEKEKDSLLFFFSSSFFSFFFQSPEGDFVRRAPRRPFSRLLLSARPVRKFSPVPGTRRLVRRFSWDCLLRDETAGQKLLSRLGTKRLVRKFS